MGDPPGRNVVDRFIREKIETVPHLEALLLLWETRPKSWPVSELAERLFVDEGVALRIVRDLSLAKLANSADGDGAFCYPAAAEWSDRLIQAVAETYKKELVRITNLIHSKASVSVREFARAFEFGRKKE